MTDDHIIIKGLRLPVRIGVTALERASPQVIDADIIIQPAKSFDRMADRLTSTVDYAAVAAHVRALAARAPRKLIETLADDIACGVLDHFSAASVTVEVRKRILPDVDHVAVRCRRIRSSA